MESRPSASKRTIRKPAGQHQRYAKGFEYQKNGIYFAQASKNLIKEAAKELKSLGAKEIDSSIRGIHFKATPQTLYRITYMTRLCSRILAPLVSFPCSDEKELYKHGKRLAWKKLLTKRSSFAIAANVHESRIDHSQFAALKLKDALVDYFRETTGKRPDVDTDDPDVRFNLYIHKDRAVINLDISNGSLHKRGYREETVLGPMQETVAAAVIRLSRWDGTTPLVDPMCGSGTLLCEALMHHCRIPAGIFRSRFGFEKLPDFNPEIWEAVKKDGIAMIRDIPQDLISGSDIARHSVEASRTNLMGLHHGNRVTITQSDFKDLQGIKNSTIVINPPYGIRMGKDLDLKQFHKDLGDFLKQKCRGSSAYIYFGDPDLIRHMGLKATWKMPISAGGLDGRLVKYEMY